MTRPGRFLVTDLWWVPQVYARVTSAHVFFLLRGGGDDARFRAFAARLGEREWLFATGRRGFPDPTAEPLEVPGAPDRGTVLDVRLYRVRARPPSP